MVATYFGYEFGFFIHRVDFERWDASYNTKIQKMGSNAIFLSAMSVFSRCMGPGSPSISLNALQLQKRDAVNEKVEKGVYGFESVPCACCGSVDSELISERDRYGLFFSVQLCKGCGMVYTSPRMTDAAYGEFYDNEYRPLYVGSERATDDFFAEQRNQGRRIYDFLRGAGVMRDSMKIVEVGCGAGGILDFFRSEGHAVLGIDLGSEYVAYGRDVHGLDLRVCMLSDLALDFVPDLVIYSHVMEHILHPLDEMKNIAKVSGSNTLVYIEVPGLKNIHKSYAMDVMKYYQNAHSYHFTLGSLRHLMESAGFKLVSGTEYVRSIFKLNTISNGAPGLAEDDTTKTVDSGVNGENGRGGVATFNEYDSIRSYLVWNERYRWVFPLTVSGLKQRAKRWKKRLLG